MEMRSPPALKTWAIGFLEGVAGGWLAHCELKGEPSSMGSHMGRGEGCRRADAWRADVCDGRMLWWVEAWPKESSREEALFAARET